MNYFDYEPVAKADCEYPITYRLKKLHDKLMKLSFFQSIK